MKHPGFTFCSLLLAIAGAVAVLSTGPCDGLTKVGKSIGEKMADEEAKAREENDVQLELKIKEYWEKQGKSQPTP